jgi:cellulase (glycosyl hydrolase family 5)
MRFLLLCVFALWTAAPWNSLKAEPVPSGFVHTQGSELVDGAGRPLLLRGTNLGNWLEPEGYMFHFGDNGPTSPREIEDYFDELIGPQQAKTFWHQYRDVYITKADIDLLQSTGMNSVRVPIHYKFFTPGNDEGLDLLDRVVSWAKADGMYVVIDMHMAPGGQTGTNIDDSYGYPWLYDSPADQQELIAIWRRIADHYHDEPTVLGYDLLNEPIPHYPQLQKYNSQLEPLYKRIAAAIREVDTHHVLILGGARWDTDFSVFGPPFDKNVMYQFHLYRFGKPWKEEDVAGDIAQYIKFRDTYAHAPIWLGESGENNDDWVRGFRMLLEKNHIGWCFWPYKKVDATSSIVSIAKPDHWDEIVKYSSERRGVGNTEKQLEMRPSPEIAAAALNQLLENAKVAKCRVNTGYIDALGLTAPVGAK